MAQRAQCDLCKKEATFPVKGSMGTYCSPECCEEEGDTPALGCKVSELQVNMEFSYDEGKSWVFVRTEPTYMNDESSTLFMRVSPEGESQLRTWKGFTADEWDNVLLRRK